MCIRTYILLQWVVAVIASRFHRSNTREARQRLSANHHPKDSIDVHYLVRTAINHLAAKSGFLKEHAAAYRLRCMKIVLPRRYEKFSDETAIMKCIIDGIIAVCKL